MKEQCTHIGDCEDASKCGCVTVNEVWKDIPEYEGVYQVSNLGRVKSLNYNREGIERVLKPSPNNYGHYQVNLYRGGARKMNSVHRLVMLAFIGESDLEVNHINGIKTDNRLENLEYCTHTENTQRAYSTGLIIITRGENHHKSKLTEAQARQIKYEHRGLTQQTIAEIYGISRSLVSHIQLGRRWNEV